MSSIQWWSIFCFNFGQQQNVNFIYNFFLFESKKNYFIDENENILDMKKFQIYMKSIAFRSKPMILFLKTESYWFYINKWINQKCEISLFFIKIKHNKEMNRIEALLFLFYLGTYLHKNLQIIMENKWYFDFRWLQLEIVSL